MVHESVPGILLEEESRPQDRSHERHESWLISILDNLAQKYTAAARFCQPAFLAVQRAREGGDGVEGGGGCRSGAPNALYGAASYVSQVSAGGGGASPCSSVEGGTPPPPRPHKKRCKGYRKKTLHLDKLFLRFFENFTCTMCKFMVRYEHGDEDQKPSCQT